MNTYRIDLLKGQGIPIKNRRGGILIICATIALPLVFAMVCYGQYMANSIHILSTKAKIEDRDNKIKERSSAVQVRAKYEKQFVSMQDCLSEIRANLGKNEQWSDVLRSIVDNLPSSMLISRIDVRANGKSRPMPDPADPNRTKSVTFISRSLQVSVLGNQKSDTISLVKNYIKQLNSAECLTSKLEDIRIIGQDVEKIGSAEMVRYDVECAFKAIPE